MIYTLLLLFLEVTHRHILAHKSQLTISKVLLERSRQGANSKMNASRLFFSSIRLKARTKCCKLPREVNLDVRLLGNTTGTLKYSLSLGLRFVSETRRKALIVRAKPCSWLLLTDYMATKLTTARIEMFRSTCLSASNLTKFSLEVSHPFALGPLSLSPKQACMLSAIGAMVVS